MKKGEEYPQNVQNGGYQLSQDKQALAKTLKWRMFNYIAYS